MPLEVTATGRPSSHASLTTAGGRATVSATSLSGGPAHGQTRRQGALISGGARGQGATETRLFVREGATVVFGDVLDDGGKKVEAEIRASGGRATYVHLNVTRETDWRRGGAPARPRARSARAAGTTSAP